jgi:hypothetical protein
MDSKLKRIRLTHPIHKICGGDVFKNTEGQWVCERCSYNNSTVVLKRASVANVKALETGRYC